MRMRENGWVYMQHAQLFSEISRKVLKNKKKKKNHTSACYGH